MKMLLNTFFAALATFAFVPAAFAEDPIGAQFSFFERGFGQTNPTAIGDDSLVFGTIDISSMLQDGTAGRKLIFDVNAINGGIVTSGGVDYANAELNSGALVDYEAGFAPSPETSVHEMPIYVKAVYNDFGKQSSVGNSFGDVESNALTYAARDSAYNFSLDDAGNLVGKLSTMQQTGGAVNAAGTGGAEAKLVVFTDHTTKWDGLIKLPAPDSGS